jgi:predicted RNA polymerase sigma factor
MQVQMRLVRRFSTSSRGRAVGNLRPPTAGSIRRPAWHRPLLLLGYATYPYLAATRADLLRRLGRTHDAAQAYRTALTLASNAAEKDLLSRRLAEVTAT